MRMSTNEWDDLGDGVPSLSNGIYPVSPPLVMVGGITFIQMRSIRACNLSVSSRFYSCYLVEVCV